MRIAGRISMLALATLAASGVAASVATASYADTPPTKQKRTVQSVQAHVNDRAQHITVKMTTMRSRIAGNKKFPAASRGVVQADITKVINDVAAWRKAVDAAKTMAAIQATAPAKKAVDTDLAKLRNDYNAAHRAIEAAAKQ